MQNPKVYRTSNNLQKCKIKFIIEEFSEELKDVCGKCMDIGCGPGDVTKELLLPNLGSNAQIIGTDISESMIKYANKRFKDKKRLQFEVLDIQTKHLPQKYISQFDHIFSSHTLHWCNDIQQAFKNIYQMLQPNGTVLLYIIASHDIYEVLRMLVQDIRFASYVLDSMKNISPFQESTNARKDLKELLKRVGFTVLHCSLREASYSENKLQNFLNSIISILKFREDMPQDLKEEFKNTLIYEYTKRKINYKSINGQELTLDLYTGLVAYAQKT
ncbi:PREDICTED: NADH dehydrogenase [ubiquinone] 1 alpha subcomplex assembly factor 5-like [Vollenhovia emeryi]|uniref:NADH dehydrogenase [ubiquinone] 1 alpha subcomplex assembly factor 5-like n=1 Tax=Vollenhovia emeryi TaxID=411798 RepID=UPI0005F37B90|nr:PREDICTED: NADH dehydrogenase [ubiquinone] 1 alpha subcomplex assembly factor 5-like [Vollenhovia emeryi]